MVEQERKTAGDAVNVCGIWRFFMHTGALDLYSSVYDIEDFRKHLSERLGFVLADNYPTAKEAVRLLEKSHVYIPPMAYRCAYAFRKYMNKDENEQ